MLMWGIKNKCSNCGNNNNNNNNNVKAVPWNNTDLILGLFSFQICNLHSPVPAHQYTSLTVPCEGIQVATRGETKQERQNGLKCNEDMLYSRRKRVVLRNMSENVSWANHGKMDWSVAKTLCISEGNVLVCQIHVCQKMFLERSVAVKTSSALFSDWHIWWHQHSCQDFFFALRKSPCLGSRKFAHVTPLTARAISESCNFVRGICGCNSVLIEKGLCKNQLSNRPFTLLYVLLIIKYAHIKTLKVLI